MGRRNKADGKNACIQKSGNGSDNVMQIPGCYRFFIPADLIILAIDALKIAMLKKDVADAFGAGYYRFFTVMSENGCDIKFIAGVAVTIFPRFPRGSTQPGAVNTKLSI